MRKDSSEPSEGAALPVSRDVTTAEKRAEYARLGLDWPKYPDGTDQQWSVDCGWKSWEFIQRIRVVNRIAKRIKRGTPLDAPLRKQCRWVTRDEFGRPSCTHGPAYRNSGQWMCSAKKIEVQIGGIRFKYRVDPDRHAEIKEMISMFKQQQATNYKEKADNGWID